MTERSGGAHDEHPELARMRWRRRLMLPALTLGSVLLIPWALYLAATLNRRGTAYGWRGTWVGFDLALALALGLTAYLVWRRRLTFVVPAVISGTMLLVDAWFDVRLSGPQDATAAVLSALLEVPAGVVLLSVAMQQMRRLQRGLMSLNLSPMTVIARGLRHPEPTQDQAPTRSDARP